MEFAVLQLDDARADAAPGLGAELLEDVDRLRGAGELEEQGLQEDGCDDQLGGPAEELDIGDAWFG